MLRRNRNRRPRTKKNSLAAVKRRRLSFQGLEQRRLLASDIGLSDGYICITGTEFDDAVDVYQDGDQIVVSSAEYGLDGEIVSSSEQSFHQDEVRGIYFEGNAGDDVFVNDTSLNAIAQGGSGNDTLISGLNRDVLHGSHGDDVLIGSRDIMMAGAGDNAILPNSGGTMQVADESTDEVADASADDIADDTVVDDEEPVAAEAVADQDVTDGDLPESDAVADVEDATGDDVGDPDAAVEDQEPTGSDDCDMPQETTGQTDETPQDQPVAEDEGTEPTDTAPEQDAFIDDQLPEVGEDGSADEIVDPADGAAEDALFDELVADDTGQEDDPIDQAPEDDADVPTDQDPPQADGVNEDESEPADEVDDVDFSEDWIGPFSGTFTFTVGAFHHHHPRSISGWWGRSQDWMWRPCMADNVDPPVEDDTPQEPVAETPGDPAADDAASDPAVQDESPADPVAEDPVDQTPAADDEADPPVIGPQPDAPGATTDDDADDSENPGPAVEEGLFGLGGLADDVLIGGEGQDVLFGGPGNDLLFGDEIDDELLAQLLADFSDDGLSA